MLSMDAAAGQRETTGMDDLTCDLRDENSVRHIFDTHQIGTIVHLAAVLPTTAQRDPVRATQVNVYASLHLLEMAKAFKVGRFIFASSLSIYGSWPDDQIVSERSHAAPEDLYGAGKLYVEQLGAAYRERGGPEFVSFRIGRVVGKGAQSRTSAWRSQIFELLRTGARSTISLPYPAPERLLLVHVDDVARGLMNLMEASRPAHTIYNAPCESITVRELKERVEDFNPNITVQMGQSPASGNPRQVDWSRFGNEYQFSIKPIAERLLLESREVNRS